MTAHCACATTVIPLRLFFRSAGSSLRNSVMSTIIGVCSTAAALAIALVAVRGAEVPLLVILEIFRQRLRHQHAEDLLRDVLVGGAFGILL